MAENIIHFQAGREAAIEGRQRDRRRSADWLEGYDAVATLDHPAPPRAEKEEENEGEN